MRHRARLLFVTKLAAWCVLAVLPALGADANIDSVLKSVENRYNRAQSLRLTFTETYSGQRRADQTESGVLLLRKPGRMRWDYTSPAGKVFVSDGKNVFLYTPATNQVEHSTLKETEDQRAPLAFLLGKLNFYKEFRSFALRPEGADTWIDAEPNSDKLPYSKVEFLVSSDARIRRLRVVSQDRSVIDFQFDQEKLNLPIDPKLFAFRTPPGAQVVEAEQ
ncbi:MAG: outer rane lipoprotein carrier protein LolA [Bryobacterales bacterium]|nr:outer rane lipoprotein carrier protein LolA [Bryobacterales bacterium]